MSFSSKLFPIATVVLIFACAFLLYSWIDARVTIDHSRQEQINQDRTIALLFDLVKSLGSHSTKVELVKISNALSQRGYVVHVEPDSIEIGEIVLKFKDDKFIGVDHLE